MLYIKEVSKKNQEVKVIYSLERPDIEFIWSIETVKKSIKKGHDYKTVYTENNKLIEGSLVSLTKEFESNGRIHPEYLITARNSVINDNLSELPRF